MKSSSPKKPSEKKDRLIFIDWDGTISNDQLWKSLRTERSPFIETGNKIDEILFSKNKTLVKQWMKGKHTSEDINMFLSFKLGVSYASLWQTFVKDSKDIQIYNEVIPLLAELKKTSYLCLVTGNMDSFTRFTIKSQKLHKYFDLIVNSYDTKRLKTDYNGLEFRRIAKELQMPFESSIILDDSERVCNIFLKNGGKKAYHIKNRKDTILHLQKLVKHKLHSAAARQ